MTLGRCWKAIDGSILCLAYQLQEQVRWQIQGGVLPQTLQLSERPNLPNRQNDKSDTYRRLRSLLWNWTYSLTLCAALHHLRCLWRTNIPVGCWGEAPAVCMGTVTSSITIDTVNTTLPNGQSINFTSDWLLSAFHVLWMSCQSGLLSVQPKACSTMQRVVFYHTWPVP